jgi:hypothetical protein
LQNQAKMPLIATGRGTQSMNLKNRSRWLAALVVSVLFSTSTLVQADILDNWHWRNPSPFSDTMHSVCFGAGKFVAVGDGGVIHTSTDGMAWDAGQRPGLFNLNKVIYANGEFVAVGDLGAILTSSNAVDWTARDADVATDLYAVAFGNGRFVACGASGQLVVSTNGTNWGPVADNSVDSTWITFGNGLFMAKGPGTSVEISADGQTWGNIGLPVSGFSWPHALYQVEYGNGIFVAVVGDETNPGPPFSPAPVSHFYASVDGTNWTQKAGVNFGPTPQAFYTHQFFIFLNGSFHEVTYGSSYGTVPISITLDGTSCITKYAPTNATSAKSMAYGNGRYVLVSDGGLAWYSTDETNWVAENSGFQNQVNQIIGGQSNLVAFASSLPVLVSPDGVAFSAVSNSPAGVLTTGTFDGTNYVAVGASVQGPFTYIGEIYTSTNTTDWVRRTSNANQPLYAICRGPSRWVAVGGGGTVTTSPNTLAWTLRSSGTANNLRGVAFGSGIYVAVGSIGTLITSTDGAAWDVQFSGTSADLLSVRFLNGQFIATGRGGAIITSPDGINWTGQNSGVTASLFAVDYGYGGYLACGNDDDSYPSVGDVFLTSSNGTNWQNISTKIPTAAIARSVAYLNQSFWIVGDNGMILQSDVADGIPHLAASPMPGNAGIRLAVTLNPAGSYRVQFRTNLLTDTWHDVYTNSSPITSDSWTDTNTWQRPSGYYRIVSP